MLFEVPGYEIMEKLSENTVFRVYRGQRIQDRKDVLLKVLNQPYPTAKYLAPLWQEFEILRLLDFPGVEKAYTLESHLQQWMIVLEDFGGQPLTELEIAGSMEPEEYLTLALQLAEIVANIHACQVIHKNISPANISYNPSTREARLTNFGYAALISKEKAPLQSPYKLAEFLAYISPEMTGRMNRSVDYRTDYYSLGATLYELLTGTPPFLGESPLELVYAHLAILPDPPASRIRPWRSSPTAFQILSAILLKLLAKNPEDRYQTPTALQADLRQCLSALQEPYEEGLERPVFIPGQVDRPVDLKIPQIVVGREQETEALLQAFLRTIGGPREVVLVNGEAGVGKTTLVNQLLRPVTERKGLFLYAKYDQVLRQEVYQALIGVLEEFCWQVLSEPTPSFQDWRERVQAAVAPHGQLLIDLCPQFGKVIGPQPPVEQFEEESTRLRLHQVVIRFLQAICQPDHPVVIFLDDLQWTNPDSLLLWQSVLSTPSIQNLLVVGAYRDNEVGPEHPIHQWVNELRTAQVDLTQLQIENLEWPVIHRLVAAALASDPAEISDLTTLIFLRTEGNPYFSNEFLKSLYKSQLLIFNFDEQKWRWDTDRIEEYGVASNVVDLFIHELGYLDEYTQKILQYAACLGRRFDATTLLAMVGPDNANSLAYSLWQAMTEGLIQPLDENYRFLAVEKTDSFSAENSELLPNLTDLLAEEILFEFQHDRVQQAVLAMLDEQQLKSTSLQMGWLLLDKAERAGHESVQESLLAIVDHLNRGSALIKEPTEAIKAAHLNLMASNRARAIAAYDTASRYLSAGMQLLPANSWQEQYTLTLEMFIAGAEVAMLNSDLAQAEALALSAEANARSPLEKARIINILMEIYLTQTQTGHVIELGMAAIQMLGFDLEVKEPPAFIGEQIMQLPAMTEPRALAVSGFAEPLVTVLFGKNDPRLAQIIYFYINLFSRFGNPPIAGYIYITYGALILLSQFEQVEQGCLMGRLALELTEKGGPSKTLFIVRFVYYSFIHHWLEPAREAIGPLYENIQSAFEAGDLRYFITSQDLVVQVSLFVGMKLEEVRSKQAEALRRLALLKRVGYTQRLRIWSQFVLKLMGELPDPQENIGELFDRDEAQTLIEGGQNPLFLFNMYVSQAYLSLLFRDPQRTLESSSLAHGIKLGVRTQLNFAQHQFVYSLALLSAGLEAGDQAERLEKVEENLRLMRLWAGLVPENFLHQLELVEAEQSRCLGNEEQAAERYEQAIKDAKRNGYIHEHALAAELAAEFYLAREDYTTAINHLFTAYYAYLAWGAKAKVDDLVNRYPEWLPPRRDDEKHLIFHPAAEDLPLDEIASSIDLSTILKASLELAQETNLEKLLRKLMSILVENTGAQNGSLVLWRDDRWFLEVQVSADPEHEFALLSIPLEDQATQAGGQNIPTSIIHYVINSQVDLVLNDASTSHQFSQDPYIQSRRPKSILCAPLLNQGMASGVVYLENNLTSGAFTSDRLEIVQLISGQAAVSIEKARLYENLEALVDERTRELSDANRKLKEEIDERIRVEEALRLSEARYRTVFENTGTAMAVIDDKGYILLTNEEFVRLTGYSKSVLEDYFDSMSLSAPTDVARIREIRQARLVDPAQAPHSFEFQLVDSSGKEKAVISTSTILPDSKSVIISLIDISQRKQAESELHHAIQELVTTEEELRSQNEALTQTLEELAAAKYLIDAEKQRYIDLFDFAPDAYFATDLEGKISEANHAAASLLGSKNENLTGNLLISFLGMEDRKAFRTRLTEMASMQEASIEKVGYRDWEVRMHKQDGSPFDASIVVALESGNQEGPTSLRWLVRDISAYKRAQEALRESEERLRSITDNAPDFIAELDLQGRILYANHPPEGDQHKDLIGASIFDFIPGEFHSEVRDALEQVGRSGEMMQVEFKQTLTHNMERWQSANIAPIMGSDGLMHFVLISTDLTVQKWIEEQLRSSEERFRTALENLLDGFAILSTVNDDQGRVIDFCYEYINTKGSQFLLGSIVQPLGQRIIEAFPQFADSQLMQEAIQLIETGDPLIHVGYPLREHFGDLVSDIAVDLQAFRLTEDEIAVTWRDVTERVRQQKALREAEEFTRYTLNSLSEHIAILDEDGLILWVNRAWMNFTQANGGDPVKTGVGVNYLEVCDRANGPEADTGFKFAEGIRSTLRGEVETFELEYICSSPEELRWYIGRVTTFMMGDSQRVVIAHDDVTQIKKYEYALQKSEELYRAVVNTQTEMVCRFLPDTTLTFVNEAYCRVVGKTAGELIGQSFLITLPEEIQATVQNIVRGMLEHPEILENELEIISPSGETRWQHWVNNPIFEQGRVVEFQAVGFDITERKKMEQMLQENEARLRLALDSAQLAPFEYNLLTGELVWDERAKLMWGLPVGESPDYAESLQRVHPKDRQRAEEELAKAIDPTGTGDFKHEFRVLWPDGSVHWISAQGKVSFDVVQEQRRAVRLLGILHDITERKSAEEALRYNEALLRKVLEILPVGVWIMDKTTKIIMGNPEGQRIWSGAKYVELQDYGEYKAWRVDSGEQITAEQWAGGLAVTKMQTTLNEELEIEAFDGHRRIILNSAIPLVTSEDGLVGGIVVNQDITQLKHKEEELQKALDQLYTLLQISQSIVSTLDLDQLLNMIIEQLGKVMPYEAAAILILEQDCLRFRVIRGPSIFHNLSQFEIPANEPTLIEPLIRGREIFYLPDLQTEEDLLLKIQDTIQIPSAQFAFLRSWLGLPLIARDNMVGFLVLAHSQPDYYSHQSRILSQAYTNQVAIAINNAQLYEQVGNVAALEERNRLARELHDSVAQALYSISLFTNATQMALETNKPEVVKNNLGELVELSKQAMADMRLLIFELRPPMLEEVGFVAALQSRLDAVEARAGLQAVFHSKGKFKFSSEQESELYWIAQEALNNVIKYAHADQVQVQLFEEAGDFRMIIQDNGVGFDPDTAGQAGGQGIRNMRERAEKIDSRCWIESAPGQGTKVIVEVKP